MGFLGMKYPEIPTQYSASIAISHRGYLGRGTSNYHQLCSDSWWVFQIDMCGETGDNLASLLPEGEHGI